VICEQKSSEFEAVEGVEGSRQLAIRDSRGKFGL
jgi:hypothetical protein